MPRRASSPFPPPPFPPPPFAPALTSPSLFPSDDFNEGKDEGLMRHVEAVNECISRDPRRRRRREEEEEEEEGGGGGGKGRGGEGSHFRELFRKKERVSFGPFTALTKVDFE
jgi:hypothetical protein